MENIVNRIYSDLLEEKKLSLFGNLDGVVMGIYYPQIQRLIENDGILEEDLVWVYYPNTIAYNNDIGKLFILNTFAQLRESTDIDEYLNSINYEYDMKEKIRNFINQFL